jgi:large subunit ribosomal protein L30
MSEKVLRITLIKSPISSKWNHKETVKALGLRRMNYTVEKPDNPAIRGMIATISYLLKVEEVEKS